MKSVIRLVPVCLCAVIAACVLMSGCKAETKPAPKKTETTQAAPKGEAAKAAAPAKKATPPKAPARKAVEEDEEAGVGEEM